MGDCSQLPNFAIDFRGLRARGQNCDWKRVILEARLDCNFVFIGRHSLMMTTRARGPEKKLGLLHAFVGLLLKGVLGGSRMPNCQYAIFL